MNLKNIIRKFLNSKLAITVSKVFNPVYGGVGSIIMFHRVVLSEEDIIANDIEISVKYFEELIQFFKQNNYDFISLDEMYEIINNKKQVNKFVVFTFDDGYIDNYEIVYPILKKHNIPFAIYISTSFPDEESFLWWYALKELIDTKSKIEFIINSKKYIFEVNHNNKKSVFTRIRRMFLELENNQQEIFIKNFLDTYCINYLKYSKDLTMSWENIIELSKDELVTIGAHTKNHVNLSSCTFEEASEEMSKSKSIIENKIDKKVRHFAYPFGSKKEADTREFSLAKKLKFKTAVTTRIGNIHWEYHKNMHSLPRISPNKTAESKHPELYVNGMIPALRNKFKKIV